MPQTQIPIKSMGMYRRYIFYNKYFVFRVNKNNDYFYKEIVSPLFGNIKSSRFSFSSAYLC